MGYKIKKVKPSRAELERKIAELKAQLPYVYRKALSGEGIGKAGHTHLMASGAMLRLTALGGRELFEPVLILDGLSDETITAIRADIARSLAQAVK